MSVNELIAVLDQHGFELEYEHEPLWAPPCRWYVRRVAQAQAVAWGKDRDEASMVRHILQSLRIASDPIQPALQTPYPRAQAG